MSTRVGNRLTDAQQRVLKAVLDGAVRLGSIAHAAGMADYVAQHTLDALFRRNLVGLTDQGLYYAHDRSEQVLEAQ